MATDDDLYIELTLTELRAVAGYALACARPAVALFDRDYPDDPRPRAVLDEAAAFAEGGRRTKALRVTALDAHRSARTARDEHRWAAAEAARAAGHAGAAGYLHPLAKATQVLHILGSAGNAARAFELDAGGDPAIGAAHLDRARDLADATVVSVLHRYPAAPGGGGRVGELVRTLDIALRSDGR
ncbi:putative immunity protein [Prauserella cavernicola]|uniref:Exonuclease SbcC n=1 Tax=Prauserella cavernicola TaxID=2800127 RepID=A0A934QMA9_9PSEU|nr:exonuclease SbcC [Prauserella cavernicola]MBK1783036.1 exonuclease SbcC [Prauserella cavernicola]